MGGEYAYELASDLGKLVKKGAGVGTMIQLCLGHLTVDAGKNEYFKNHGVLFQASDLKQVPSYYAGKNWPNDDDIVEMNEGFGKPLGQILDRLELMGHTLRSVRHRFEWIRQTQDRDSRPPRLSLLRNALAQVDVTKLTGKYREDYVPGQFVTKRTLRRMALGSEAHHYYQPGLRPDHWEADLLLENFLPYEGLRLLGLNEANRAVDVTWDFTPLVESGWARREQFQPGPSAEQKFLVVTEGSSDAKIIQKAIALYRPHIADFFTFVDMEEGYPFSGTGNLHKFVQGLVSIGVQNNTVVIYDNDAEGISKMKATRQLSLPFNVRVTQLPIHRDFSDFKTLGPDGVGRGDINGKAASIECYLDLRRKGLPRPIVRWTSFNRDLQSYQGELQHKTQYMKDFLRMNPGEKGYDARRIEAVLDRLTHECISIAEERQRTQLPSAPLD